MVIDHVTEALKATGIEAEVLGAAYRSAIIAKLGLSFAIDLSKSTAWDRANAPDGKQRIDGWELIPQFVVPSTACLMFLDGARTIWRLNNGNDLLEVLKECPPLEFYVCDDDARYLLCSNHHDVVIGWGEARHWVSGLAHRPEM